MPFTVTICKYNQIQSSSSRAEECQSGHGSSIAQITVIFNTKWILQMLQFYLLPCARVDGFGGVLMLGCVVSACLSSRWLWLRLFVLVVMHL